MATLLVSGFDYPHGNHHDLVYKPLWIHTEMEPREFCLQHPNLFMHHHFQISPGALPSKIPIVQTGFRQFLQIFRTSAMKDIKQLSVTRKATANKYSEESLHL